MNSTPWPGQVGKGMKRSLLLKGIVLFLLILAAVIFFLTRPAA